MTTNYFKDMADSVLLDFAEAVYLELIEVADTQPESEEHEECFAALLITAQEMVKRGLKRKG